MIAEFMTKPFQGVQRSQGPQHGSHKQGILQSCPRQGGFIKGKCMALYLTKTKNESGESTPQESVEGCT